MGPEKYVRYSRDIVITGKPVWDQKNGSIFVRYGRDFVLTMIIITEFDFINKKGGLKCVPSFIPEKWYIFAGDGRWLTPK